MVPPTMLVVALLGIVAVHAGYAELIAIGRAAATASASLVVLCVLTIGYRLTAPARPA